MVTLLLVGAGRWGKNYISTVAESFPDVSLVVAGRSDWKSALDKLPDGCIVATPPQSHVEIASYALERNIPCLIEKPLALTLQETQELQKYSNLIMVNHIDLFSDGFIQLKNKIKSRTIRSIEVEIMGSGPVRSYSSLLDYGPHAVAIVLALTESKPIYSNINIKKIDSINIVPETHLYSITIPFENGVIGTCMVGNGHVDKIRRYLVTMQDDYLLGYDDIFKAQYRAPLINVIDKFLSFISGQTIESWRNFDISKDVTDILLRY